MGPVLCGVIARPSHVQRTCACVSVCAPVCPWCLLCVSNISRILCCVSSVCLSVCNQFYEAVRGYGPVAHTVRQALVQLASVVGPALPDVTARASHAQHLLHCVQRVTGQRCDFVLYCE